MPNGKCRVHGGLTPTGIASPHYKTGARSKYLPTRLLGRVEEALNDPGLLDLRRDIALLEARLSEVLGQLDRDGAGDWSEVRSSYLALVAAIRRQDKAGITTILSQLNTLISKGADDAALWEQVGVLLEQRRRAIESESRRMVQMQQTISVNQAMVLVTALLASIKEHVTDRQALAKIQNDFIRLTTQEPRPSAIDVTPE
jgi:hypothetical protein